MTIENRMEKHLKKAPSTVEGAFFKIENDLR